MKSISALIQTGCWGNQYFRDHCFFVFTALESGLGQAAVGPASLKIGTGRIGKISFDSLRDEPFGTRPVIGRRE